MKKIFFLFCLLATSVHGAKIHVVATTPEFGALARELGGDRIDLITLGRPTEDPHFVDAKPSYILRLNRADVLIEGGAELEVGWLPALLDQARNPKLDAGKPGHVACADGISMLEVPATLDRSKGDLHAAGNPHYMSDPENARSAAGKIADAFCRTDSKSCDFYKANLKKFNDKLAQKMPEWQAALAPFKGREVVSYHNLWPYFAKRFGIKMDLFLEPKPGIPPTPAHLAEVITQMKAQKIRVIIVQPYQNRKTAETVASRTDGVVLNFPTFPGVKGEQSYIDWMDGLVTSLANALKNHS